MKSQIPNPKRCEVRAFELIYDNISPSLNQEILCKKLCKLKYGVYKFFSVIHTLKESSHIHIGLILRDKPRDLYYAQLKEYFTIDTYIPKQVGKLKSKSKDFIKKLTTYLDYTLDQSQHEGQIISEPYFYKFTPPKESEQMPPTQYLSSLIRNGLTIAQLDDYIDSDQWSLKVWSNALSNYDKYIKMIEQLQTIKEKKAMAILYEKKKKKYLSRQKKMKNILDTQNDRQIAFVIQPHPDGNGGKTHFCKTENLREDTCFMTNGKTSSLAYSWNPKKHKRIVFNIPKNGMRDLNYTAIEALKDGAIFSQKYKSYAKVAQFNPRILICGNEYPDNNWTDDRLEIYTMNTDLQLVKEEKDFV